MADVQNDSVLIPTAVLDASPGTVAALNEVLRAADPALSIEEPATKGPTNGVTRLRVSTEDAARVVELLRAAKDVPAAAQVSGNPRYDAGPTLLASGSKIGHALEGLAPVSLHAPAPVWDERVTGRRPVVALLDSGVDTTHPWLDEPAFCVHAPSFVPADDPAGDFTGHGTFSAGLIRQYAPQARVLSVRVMTGAGQVDGGAFENALTDLLDEFGSRRFDVLCLPFGHEPDPASHPDGHAERVRASLTAIAGHGVQIVASAGNQGHKVPTYPAAFAVEGITGMQSVGALNHDGTRAHYSNFGDWVTDTELGSAVVSTMPTTLDGEKVGPVQELDPDDFRSGFARWSGTSFAAAIRAAKHAASRTP